MAMESSQPPARWPMSVLERNNVHVAGAGTQPMLFAHGFGCDQSMWRWITPAFAETHRTIVFDHVGGGRSDLASYSRAKYRSLPGYADDILEICEALNLAHIVFVGHSVSAMMGVLAAIKQPDRFDSLILIGPSPRYINAESDRYVGGFSEHDIRELLEFQDANYLGWSSTLAPIIMGNPDRPELAAELTNSFCRTDPEIAKQFAAVTFLSDNRADLARVTVPALIIQSREDAIAPLSVGEYVHQHMLGSHLEVLDTSGHCPHLSAPNATIAAIKQFLDK
ncbi:MAG: alpha/beta hydrolase [Chloroflexota bacterium]